jgi:hypothetical protein
MSDLYRTLERLIDAADAYRADQDHATDYCGAKDMMVEKYKCTRFPKEKTADGD